MTQRPTIGQLWAAYRNEDAHSRHVARLAVQLFDACNHLTGMRPIDRRLLKAACLLHDIGYAVKPHRHACASAKIILQEGVAGFTSGQVHCIAAAVLLHAQSYEPFLRHPAIRALRDHARAFKLAAILRVADALDRGHIQDLSIRSARIVNHMLRVRVSCDGYPDSPARAEDKADLWRQAMPIGIEFTATQPAFKNARYHSAVSAGNPQEETANRLLYLLYRCITGNYQGAIEAQSPEPLHDLRGAMRRFRTVLRLFRAPLSGTSAIKIDRDLSGFCSQLGPIRDADVWIAYLRARGRSTRITKSRRWRPYLLAEEAHRKRLAKELRRVLQSNRYRLTMRRAAMLLRVEIPELLRRCPSGPLAPYAAKKLRRVLQRIAEQPDPDKKSCPGELHSLRKLCRRGRYCAEFFSPALGRPIAALGRQCKAVADALGAMHDCDVALERVAAAHLPAPRALRDHIEQERQRCWREFEAAWEKLRRKKLQKSVERSLAQL
jgi:CHAD domain-containing protein